MKVINHQAVLSHPRSHCSTFQALFLSTKRTISMWRLHLFTGINRETMLTKLVSTVVVLLFIHISPKIIMPVPFNLTGIRGYPICMD